MDEISFEEFKKIEIKIGKIISAEKVENTDKLLKLQIDIGEVIKTAVAGIANYYKTEQLVGKKIAVVTNLKPIKLKGIVSEVMILAADAGEIVSVLCPDKDVPEGSTVR